VIRVSELTIYPIKSCAGTTLTHAEVQEQGLRNDRRWMLVDESNVALTQRDIFKMALIHPRLSQTESGETTIKLSAPDYDDFVLTPSSVKNGKPPLWVQVWNDPCEAIDQGDAVAQWFSTYLGKKCRLVEMAPDFHRIVDQMYATEKTDHVSFADGFPVLIISQASLDDLNTRLKEPILMNRFRPNIVVTGCEPFAEDDWKNIKIGETEFAIVKPCARCVITTIDQFTGTLTGEPLKTLKTFRNVNNKLMFGQNVIPKSAGKIRLADQITVLA